MLLNVNIVNDKEYNDYEHNEYKRNIKKMFHSLLGALMMTFLFYFNKEY